MSDGSNSQGSVSLEVEATHQSLFAHLRFFNPSHENNLYLEKRKVFDTPTPRTNVFRVQCDGQKIGYKGELAKRVPPGRADFLLLPPGKDFSKTVDISNLYEFLPGRHTYSIEYFAFHANPNEDEDLLELKSNTVTFDLSR
jgi:hypothetical protein